VTFLLPGEAKVRRRNCHHVYACLWVRTRVTVLSLCLGSDSLLRVFFLNKLTSDGLLREENIDNDILIEEIESGSLYKRKN
jgi:hypothetical protein